MPKLADVKRYLKDEFVAIRNWKKHLPELRPLANRRQYFHLVGQYRYLFNCYLSASQVSHRWNLGDPIPPMVEAVELAKQLASLWCVGNKLRGYEGLGSLEPESPDFGLPPRDPDLTAEGWRWSQIPQRIDVIGFRFGLSALLSLLVQDELSEEILGAVPRASTWTEEGFFNPLNFTDAGLVETLQTGKRPRRWRLFLESITSTFGTSLMQETMENYVELILSARAKNWETALGCVRTAEKLYERRANHDYDEFLTEDGVIGLNCFQFDVRLAALMRYCFRGHERVLDRCRSIHRWPK